MTRHLDQTIEERTRKNTPSFILTSNGSIVAKADTCQHLKSNLTTPTSPRDLLGKCIEWQMVLASATNDLTGKQRKRRRAQWRPASRSWRRCIKHWQSTSTTPDESPTRWRNPTGAHRSSTSSTSFSTSSRRPRGTSGQRLSTSSETTASVK